MQQPQFQLPQLPEVPQPSPPPPVASLPLMQSLQTPQSMSDHPPVNEDGEESTCPDCGDLEGRCRCHRRGRRRGTRSRHHRQRSVGGGGCCSHEGRGERGHKFRRCIMGVVWGVVISMVVWGAWTMYHGFRHRGPPGPSFLGWVRKVGASFLFDALLL